jgi:hypothetical protein
MPTDNPITQNDDALFYNEVCAYVRGEPDKVRRGTVGQEQAEIARRLFKECPAILNDKGRLADIAAIHYRESGAEAQVAFFAEMEKKHDGELFADLRDYVRGKRHKIRAGTIGEGWAKHAKELALDDPTILDDQPRLLAAARGFEPEPEPLESPEGWLIHRGKVNRDCISDAEYKRRMERRRAAAEMIDPATAELKWWYGETLDPYGDGLPLLPFFSRSAVNISRAHLAPRSGSILEIFLTRRERRSGSASKTQRARSCALLSTPMGNLG